MFNSQYLQDKFLEENVFKGFKNGFFFDVGAHDGLNINNTLYFEKFNNWTGVNIEPMKNIYDRLVINRPNCINLNIAISNNDGNAEFIYNTGYTEMLSGLKDTYDQRHFNRLNNENLQFGSKTDTINVITNKMETICNNHNIEHMHYLSIDVEGAEFEVIKSINFDKVFIDVIEFENNYPDNSKEIIEYLLNKNYKLLLYSHDIFMIHNNSQFIKNL
jgi:FkbM family methyltransferase